MTTYKNYVENAVIPQSWDSDALMAVGTEHDCNPAGEFLLTMEGLFALLPQKALCLYLRALMDARVFVHDEVREALAGAFDEAIDHERGGLTEAGFRRYARYSNFVGCTASQHGTWVQFTKFGVRPVGRIADLGGNARANGVVDLGRTSAANVAR